METSSWSYFASHMALSLITESAQEVFLDPILESIVSTTLQEMGYNAYVQAVGAVLVEAGREAGTGVINQRQSQSFKTIVEQNGKVYSHLTSTELNEMYQNYKADPASDTSFGAQPLSTGFRFLISFKI